MSSNIGLLDRRRFSGDESFLKDPNAFNDAANTSNTKGTATQSDDKDSKL